MGSSIMNIEFIARRIEENEKGVYEWRNYTFSSLYLFLDFLRENEPHEFDRIISEVKFFLKETSS